MNLSLVISSISAVSLSSPSLPSSSSSHPHSHYCNDHIKTGPDTPTSYRPVCLLFPANTEMLVFKQPGRCRPILTFNADYVCFSPLWPCVTYFLSAYMKETLSLLNNISVFQDLLKMYNKPNFSEYSPLSKNICELTDEEYEDHGELTESCRSLITSLIHPGMKNI